MQKHELTGKLHRVEEMQTFGSGFQKREFVLLAEGPQNDKIKMELRHDHINVIDQFRTGAEIRVCFYIQGREHQGRFYNNLIAFKLEEVAA